MAYLAPDSVAWRWEALGAVTKVAPEQAVARLRHTYGDDSQLLRLYEFKRCCDRGIVGDDAITKAYHVYLNRPKLRIFLEGLLLAGVSPYDITQTHGYRGTCSQDVVEAYHDAFFDVQPRLDQHGWVAECLFNGTLYHGISPRDTIAMYHRIAWLGGPAIFKSFFFRDKAKEMQAEIVEIIREILRRQGCLTALCLSNRPDNEVESIRLLIEDTNRQIGDTVADATSAEAGKAVKAFLGSLSIEVASGMDTANLTLPAREDRVATQLAEVMR